MLEPDNIGHKEMLLFFYQVPDLPDEWVSKEEAMNITEQILKEDPRNEAAKNFLDFWS